MKTETFTFSFSKEDRNALIGLVEEKIALLMEDIDSCTDEDGKAFRGWAVPVQQARKQISNYKQLLNKLAS